MVIWQDAAFSYRKKFPKESIPMQVTFGIFLGETKKAIEIGMNCHLNHNSKEIVGGKDVFLIPKGVIKEIKNIGDFND